MDVFAAAAAADMDGGEDQNSSTATNGNPQTSGNSRTPQISQMSLYERQAVQVRVGLMVYRLSDQIAVNVCL